MEEGTATAVLQVSEVFQTANLAHATNTAQSWTLKTAKKVVIARFVLIIASNQLNLFHLLFRKTLREIDATDASLAILV